MKKYKMWKQIDFVKGIEAQRYLISQNGEIKSVISNKILSTHIHNCGYEYVTLYCNGYHRSIEVHRLVAMAFIPNRHNKPEVNHKDGKKLHNTISNLEWVTRSENQVDQHVRNATQYTPQYCIICGKEISKNASMCVECRNNLRSTNIPQKQYVEQLLLTHKGNFEKVGRIFDVSGNAVRKWCKHYDMSFHSKDYAPEKPVKEKYIRQPVPVKQIDKQSLQVVKIWDDYLDAQKELGLNHIKEIIEKRSHRKSEGGYLWELV